MLRRLSLATACLCLSIAAHAITVRVTDADGARVQVSLYAGDVLRVDLPAEPAAGKQWGLTGRKPPQLEQLGAAQRVFGGRMSNQGTSSFAWRAAAAGEADLTLGYGTAANRADRPERTISLQVGIAPNPISADTSAPDALSHMEHVGTFARTERCGDCMALEEHLELYRSPRGGVFVLRRQYKDAPGGTLTAIMSGTWSAGSGTVDAAVTIYTLEGGEMAEQFRRDGDRLIPVDAQQIPVPAPPGEDNAFHKIATP
jgi:predicted secreted protein